jgi:sugar phosphate isomerase/epimerase
MRLGDATHLTYCTNVHRGEHWTEVAANLRQHVSAVKAQVSPAEPFGVGLWLSSGAAASLEDGALPQLLELLDELQLYVFTLNGFPYGAFHGGAIKARVYEPDWRDPRRLAYSNTLAELLARLLPPALNGSISTLPGGFRPSIRTPDDEQAVADNLLQHVAHLHRVEQRTGKRITLALEPEPCCYLETTAEAIAFFDNQLRTARAQRRLRELTGASSAQAAELLDRHLGVCLDVCHAAVEFEDAAELVAALRAAGVRVAKIQLSCGLRLPHVDAAARAALTPYLDEVYLHQVVERSASHGLQRYLDLPDALRASAERSATGEPAPEWRVHFHVPVFMERLSHFQSTQPFLREILALQRQRSISDHLEVETYTWDVLPDEARELDLPAAIARELRFCMAELSQPS